MNRTVFDTNNTARYSREGKRRKGRPRKYSGGKKDKTRIKLIIELAKARGVNCNVRRRVKPRGETSPTFYGGKTKICDFEAENTT